MAGSKYSIGFSHIRPDEDALWQIDDADTFAAGAFLLKSGEGIRLYLFPDHLRSLREAITQALGEAPQDISKLDEVHSLLSNIDGAAAAISRILWPATRIPCE